MSDGGIAALEGLSTSQLDALSSNPPTEDNLLETTHEFVRRINITLNISTTAEQNASFCEDPFVDAGQYGLGWIYFCLVLLVLATASNIYRSWTDKMRRALHKEVVFQREQALKKVFAPKPYGFNVGEALEMETPQSSTSAIPLFPGPPGQAPDQTSTPMWSPSVIDADSSLSIPFIHKFVALVRYFTYRPTPTFWFGNTMLSFASLNIIRIVGAAIVFVSLFSFVPQPYFYPRIEDGSPPLAIRSGMMALAMIPWVVATGMKVNIISLLTGIGHERLSVLHRWGGYICLGLALLHTIPFYVQPVWDSQVALSNYFAAGYFWQTPYVYGSGLAALIPLAFLCLHSLPVLRSKLYEVFVFLHIPASVAFLALLFWHTNNVLGSWGYLFATVGIWIAALSSRLLFLNWAAFWRPSWLRGEAATVTVLPENAVKVTIPSQVRWKAGQFVYLRIPQISWLENHPFTIAALCDSKLPSAYGHKYRDMIIVFRPFQGFTRRLLNASLKNGPNHIYHALVDGPHGGMQRDLVAFDTVVFVAGGSGITAVISHLLLLVHKMREESAVTKRVFVIWAMKRPESADWFTEELRICRQFAPEGSVHCEFYITAATKCASTFALPQSPTHTLETNTVTAARSAVVKETELSLHQKVDSAFSGIANKRNSALVREAADDDLERAQTLASESTDAIKPLPAAHISPLLESSSQAPRRPKAKLKLTIPESKRPAPTMTTKHDDDHIDTTRNQEIQKPYQADIQGFDFGFGRADLDEVNNVNAIKKSSFSAGSIADSKHGQAFFSPASTLTGKTPNSSTELICKSTSPMHYEDNTSQSQQQPGGQFSCFPPPPTGTAQTGGTQKIRSPVIPPPGQTFPFPSINSQTQQTYQTSRYGAANSSATGNTTGWSTEYGRPDIPALLRQFEGEFGRRAAIFVCGPEKMRRDVMRETARMQQRVWKTAGLSGGIDEVYLRVENYRL